MNTEHFLELFGKEKHYFQWFKDCKESDHDVRPGNRFVSYIDFEQNLNQINALGGGVYFTVNASNGQSRTAENIESVRALFVDLDGAPLEPVLNCEPSPSVIVQTRPGRYHAYWLVADCPLEKFSGLQKLLAQKFGGDTSVHDLPRVMRIPGFYNLKNPKKPFMVQVVGGNKKQYFLQTIIDGLRLEDLAEKIADRIEAKHEKLDKQIEEKIAEAGERHATLFSMGRKYAALGYTESQIRGLLIDANMRFIPPLPDRRLRPEIDSIINFCKQYEGGVLGSIQLVFESENGEEKVLKIDAEADAIKNRKRLKINNHIVETTPGFLGKLTNLYIETAIWPQPILALQAAIVTISTLKGKGCQGHFGGWCNVFTVGTGGAATGKGHGLACVDKIVALAGVEERLSGKCVSGAGIATALQRGGGITTSMVDEAGFYFEQMLSEKTANPNSIALKEALMAVFNAKRKVRGSEYSSRTGTANRLDIDEPFFNFYGVCTPDTFFRSIRKAHSVDGMLSRILYFRGPDKQTESKRNWDAKSGDGQIPLDLEDYLLSLTNVSRELRTQATPMKYKGNAFELFISRVEQIDKMVALCDDPIEQPLRGRMAEYLDKLIVIAADGDMVTPEVVEWCYKLVMACTDDLVTMIENTVFDTEQEEKIHTMKAYIDLHPNGIGKEALTNKFRGWKTSIRNEILDTLIATGDVVKIANKGESSRVSHFYMSKRHFTLWTTAQSKKLHR